MFKTRNNERTDERTMRLYCSLIFLFRKLMSVAAWELGECLERIWRGETYWVQRDETDVKKWITHRHMGGDVGPPSPEAIVVIL